MVTVWSTFNGWMGTQAAQNWLLLANLLALGIYVWLTHGIKQASNEQTLASRKLAQWQRDQWQLDSRKQEWKELLETLTRCVQEIEKVKSASVNTVAAWDYVNPALLEGSRVIRDRLFIADVVSREDREDIESEWKEIERMAHLN